MTKTLPPPTGHPVISKTLPTYFTEHWAVFVYPHTTKHNFLHVVAKHMKRQMAIHKDIPTDGLDAFNPEREMI